MVMSKMMQLLLLTSCAPATFQVFLPFCSGCTCQLHLLLKFFVTFADEEKIKTQQIYYFFLETSIVLFLLLVLCLYICNFMLYWRH